MQSHVSFAAGIFVLTMLLIGGCAEEDNVTVPPATVNNPPVLSGIFSARNMIMEGDTTILHCTASDLDGDSLTFSWSAGSGFIEGSTMATGACQIAPEPMQSPQDTTVVTISVGVSDGESDTLGQLSISMVNGDLWHDTGEPFIDQPDSSGNYDGVFDAQEPWIDLPNEFGVNNIGVYDLWDPFSDLNANGYWDAGELWFDLPSGFRGAGESRGIPVLNGEYDGPNNAFDEYELYTYPSSLDASPDARLPVVYKWQDLLTAESPSYSWLLLAEIENGIPGYLFYQVDLSTWTDRDGDGVFDLPSTGMESTQDLWYDTGEPFIDLPDGEGHYNGQWDPGEFWIDLPSGYPGNDFAPRIAPNVNGLYDGPNFAFDEYELFTIISSQDVRIPVLYTWANLPEDFPIGAPEWLSLPLLPGGVPGYRGRIPEKSTWLDQNGNGIFDLP
jgi:hypothetical protein